MNDWSDKLGVPRAPFVPFVVWVDDSATGGLVAIDRDVDAARWWSLVRADEPIVTQVDDGTTAQAAVGWRPTSSSSAPSLVAAMLDALNVEPGQRVLEIGTGTGWNTALLADRVTTTGSVVSVEVDPAVAEQARAALVATGYDDRVRVVVADGADGHPAGAPYDRVIATASARTIPRAWLDQTVPDGLIVTPWGTDFGDGALTRLRVDPDGSATGRCGQRLAFMRLRAQRRGYLDPTDAELSTATVSTTSRSGHELFEMTDADHAGFTIGLRVPDTYLTIEDINDTCRHVELHDRHTGSWARVTMLRGEHPWTVHQLGPRALWTEVDAAYTWWTHAGRPAPHAYQLTVTPNGTHTVTVDIPDGRSSWPVATTSTPD